MHATINKHDCKISARLTIAFLVSWLLPQRTWPTACRQLARLHIAIVRANPAVTVELKKFGVSIPHDELQLRWRAHKYLSDIELAREYRYGGWDVDLAISGGEQIKAGFARSKGVVLWVAPVQHSNLVFKKALAKFGFKVNHLSRYDHPFSSTQFGLNCLNLVSTKAEMHYLKQRIVIDKCGAHSAVQRLKSLLQMNELCTISAVSTGRKTIEREFLGGTISLALGAPSIAREIDATLLPLFVLPSGDGYRIEIGSRLPTECFDKCVDQFLSQYKVAILSSPEIWDGWFKRRSGRILA